LPLHQPRSFTHRAPERLLAHDPFQLCALLHCLDNLLHQLDARKVGGVDGDGIHVVHQLGDGREYLAFTKAGAANGFGQGLSPVKRINAGDFNAAHLLDCPRVEMGDKTSADDA
jgi:hypothetical protein